MSPWSDQLTAFVVGLAVVVFSSIAAKRCPLISVVAVILSLAPAILAENMDGDGKLGRQGFLGWAKLVLVVGCGTIPSLCVSAPRLRFGTARLRVKQCLGVCVTAIMGLNMLWTLTFGMGDVLANALGLCNVLQVAFLAVQTTALLCRREPLVDITTGGWVICLSTPTSWAVAYSIWNIVFCWKQWGLSKTAHMFYCLAFMVVMGRCDTFPGKDIGYYFCYARGITLGWYQVQRVYRPLWAPTSAAEYVLPDDDYWFLLAVMYCTTIFTGVILALSLRDLWTACASGHKQVSEQAPGELAGQQDDKASDTVDPPCEIATV